MADTYVVETSTGKATIVKDPQALLDYTFNWAPWLDHVSDTIVSHVMTVPSGITLTSSSVVGGTVIAWLSGGVAGTTYRIACRITTAGNRVDERSIFVWVKDR